MVAVTEAVSADEEDSVATVCGSSVAIDDEASRLEENATKVSEALGSIEADDSTPSADVVPVEAAMEEEDEAGSTGIA
jgi:hypothetical protein